MTDKHVAIESGKFAAYGGAITNQILGRGSGYWYIDGDIQETLMTGC